jgi:hypothetical protein
MIVNLVFNLFQNIVQHVVKGYGSSNIEWKQNNQPMPINMVNHLHDYEKNANPQGYEPDGMIDDFLSVIQFASFFSMPFLTFMLSGRYSLMTSVIASFHLLTMSSRVLFLCLILLICFISFSSLT